MATLLSLWSRKAGAQAYSRPEWQFIRIRIHAMTLQNCLTINHVASINMWPQPARFVKMALPGRQRCRPNISCAVLLSAPHQANQQTKSFDMEVLSYHNGVAPRNSCGFVDANGSLKLQMFFLNRRVHPLQTHATTLHECGVKLGWD